MDFIEACRKFVEIDSTPTSGTLEIANFAAELCRQAGLTVELQADTHNGVEQANVLARLSGAMGENELLLQTHLDTGEPGTYAHWTKTGANPFNASIYQDTLYGLGSANAKLDFLCKLEAVKILLAQGKKPSVWRMPFVLVGTYGEELGMTGAVKLIRKKKLNAKLALVGEATGLKLFHAGKGFAGVEVDIPFSAEEKEFREQHDLGDGTTSQSRVFHGKAAHSSVPQMGESAILKMLDYLTKLPEGLAVLTVEGGISMNTVPAHAVLEFDAVGTLKQSVGTKLVRLLRAVEAVEKEMRRYPDPEFDPQVPTLNIGVLRTFEDFIKVGGCCRLPPTVSDAVYEQWMEMLRTVCEEVGAVFRVTDYKQPFRTGDAPLVRICQEQLAGMGRPNHCGAQSAANEANVFSRFGITSLVIGPGQGVGNSHAPNEHVKIEELHAAVRFYQGVLERVCL